jgi:Spy/CpxP family protein refolding chaperone
MLKLWNCVLALSISVLTLSPVVAEDAKPKKPRAGAARKEQPAVQLPKEIELTDEQKPKIAELEKEFAPKMKELREKLDKVLTDEQKKARAEVNKEARTSGKKGKELQQAIKDATKATEEQQKQIDEVEKKIVELRQQIREKVEPILTEEQKTKLPPKPGEKKKKAKEKKNV